MSRSLNDLVSIVRQLTEIKFQYKKRLPQRNVKFSLSDPFFCLFCCVLCSGNTPETRGTAFVVYEDIFDAKNACDHLSGFNVCNRYLVVLYYQSNKAFKKLDVDKKQEELNIIKNKYNISTDDLKK